MKVVAEKTECRSISSRQKKGQWAKGYCITPVIFSNLLNVKIKCLCWIQNKLSTSFGDIICEWTHSPSHVTFALTFLPKFSWHSFPLVFSCCSNSFQSSCILDFTYLCTLRLPHYLPPPPPVPVHFILHSFLPFYPSSFFHSLWKSSWEYMTMHSKDISSCFMYASNPKQTFVFLHYKIY